MLIRESTTADAESAAQVSRLAFAPLRNLYRPTAQALANKARLIHQGMGRLIAEQAGAIVGPVQYYQEADRLRLLGLAVHPAFQKKGVARALIQRLAAIASDRSLRALSLYTVTQTGNPAIFARLGFKLVHEQPDVYSDSTSGQPLTEAYMERPVRLSVG